MRHSSDPFDAVVYIVVRHNNGTIYRIAGFPRATACTILQELAQVCPKLTPKLIFEFEARNGLGIILECRVDNRTLQMYNVHTKFSKHMSPDTSMPKQIIAMTFKNGYIHASRYQLQFALKKRGSKLFLTK